MPSDQIAVYALGGAVVVLLVVVAFLLGRRSRRAAKDAALALPPGAEALAPAFAELRGQLAQVHEKVHALDTEVQADAARRGLEDQAWHAIQQVAQAVATLDQVPGVQQHLQTQVADALQRISLINELQRMQQEREAEAFSGLQRLTAVLLGSATSGASGERVTREMLSHLPAQWLVTNHAVGGKRVEFAIRLPDNLLLPVDSKVVAQARLDLLAQAAEGDRERLAAEIVRDVESRVAEVRQYVDERTPGFAIAAIPDAAYALCGSILADAYHKYHALLVPYSLLGPFILMVHAQHHPKGANLDDAYVAQLLTAVEAHLVTAQNELNGRLSEGITRLTNARAALQGELAAASQKIAQLRAVRGSDGEEP